MKKKIILLALLALCLFAVAGYLLVRQTQQSTVASKGRYVALGDSVAAGLGLQTAKDASTDDKACGRTSDAYSQLIARSQRYQLQNSACSGATTADMTGSQQTQTALITPQLNAAFSAGKPKLITLTIGANDAHWAELISTCFQNDCASTQNTALAKTYLTSLQANLTNVLEQIRVRSNSTPPQTLVTGYYTPVSAACDRGFKGISSAEIKWVIAETAALNTTIQTAVTSSGYARFVPIDFSGHDVCSDNTPWVQGVLDKAPLHPTAAGQSVLANTIIQSLR